MEDVDAFRLLDYFSMFIFSMIIFNFSTLGVGCSVSWMIDFGYEIEVRLIWLLAPTRVLIYPLMLLFTLTAVFFINVLMFLFITSFSSIIVDSRRSFIMSDT